MNTDLYRMLAVKAGIKALLKGFKINRLYTSTNCRNVVTQYTGKQYKAGKNGLETALNDLEQAIDDRRVVYYR